MLVYRHHYETEFLRLTTDIATRGVSVEKEEKAHTQNHLLVHHYNYTAGQYKNLIASVVSNHGSQCITDTIDNSLC